MTTEETAAVRVTPLSIDYTNRDFYSLREELIARVKERVPEWYGTDSSDFGVALVEAFAYMGDVTSYYIDRVANESNILTASQRSSIINLSKTYGYNPAGYQAASCTLLFTNSSASNVVLPTKTQVFGKVIDGDVVRQVVFTTSAELTVPASGSATVAASHGYAVSSKSGNEALNSEDVAGELIGTGTGQPNQEYVLAENSVVEGSVRIFVQNGVSYGEWQYVLHLADYGPSDAVFTTTTDEDNYVSVIFGDGVSGAIPPVYASIKSDYIVGGGIVGNVSGNTLTSLYLVPGMSAEDLAILDTAINVTNSAPATGGVDPDSLDTIKFMATQSFMTSQRAVTLNDYTSLALQLPLVSKAFAVSDVSSSVTLYVAPKRVSTTTDPYPLYEDDNATLTAEWNDNNGNGLQPSVEAGLSEKTQIGVSLTVSPPAYVPVTISILYNKFPQYTPAQVEAQIKALLIQYYDYSQVSFGQTIYPEDIEFILKYAPGVANASVTELYRTDDTAGRRVLVGERDELFIFDAAAAAITLASDVSTLNALTTSLGTVTPVFSSTFYNYSLVVATGTTSVNLTPTKSDTGAVVYVNGVAHPSGTAVTISTPTATTNVTIKVIAQDLVSSKTYSVVITKA